MNLPVILTIVIVLALAGAGLFVVWRAAERDDQPPLPDEPCDSCGRWITGPRCRIVQQGQDSEDGISGGWAMVAYFHPDDVCCPCVGVDPNHVHGGAAVSQPA